MMNIQVVVVALIAAVVAGCTGYSSPMTNTDLVTLPSGEQAWRVQCQGLFGSSETCNRRAQQICKDEKVRLIDAVDGVTRDGKGKNDPREITVLCGDAPPPPALPQPVAAEPPPQPAIATELSGAPFATDSAQLSPDAQRKLDDFVVANRRYRVTRVEIAGYTDSTGPAALNTRLSQARAESVQQYLMTHGMRAERYDAQGFGPASPVASNATATGRARNRRVEIRSEGVEVHPDGP